MVLPEEDFVSKSISLVFSVVLCGLCLSFVSFSWPWSCLSLTNNFCLPLWYLQIPYKLSDMIFSTFLAEFRFSVLLETRIFLNCILYIIQNSASGNPFLLCIYVRKITSVLMHMSLLILHHSIMSADPSCLNRQIL